MKEKKKSPEGLPVQEAPENDIRGAAQEEAVPETAEETKTESADEASELAGLEQENMMLKQEYEKLRHQLYDMYELVQEMSDAKRGSAVAAAAGDNAPRVPETEEDAEKYAEMLRRYIMESPEIAALVEEAKKNKAEREKEEALKNLEKIAQLSDIRSSIAQIDNIFSNNPYLADCDMSMTDKLITAYAIVKGADAINSPRGEKPTTEELMLYYENDPDFRDAVEKQRLEQVREGMSVPVFASSEGAANAALNVGEKPKRVESVGDMLRKAWKR